MTTADSMRPRAPIKIVDVGAAEYSDSIEVYRGLTGEVPCTIVGFEANADENDKQRARYAGDGRRVYLDVAVGDGAVHTLRVCKLRGTSSFLEPNVALAAEYQSFAEWMAVVERTELRTVRLDDVTDARGADFLKLDVQGFELTVLQHAQAVLEDVAVIECEVEFVQQYVDQPLFAEIEQYLRGRDFRFHKFTGYGSRQRKPLVVGGNPIGPGTQWLWADAVFIKAPRHWATMDADKLLRTACVLDRVYASHDLAAGLYACHDDRFGSALLPAYVELLAQRGVANPSLAS